MSCFLRLIPSRSCTEVDFLVLLTKIIEKEKKSDKLKFLPHKGITTT